MAAPQLEAAAMAAPQLGVTTMLSKLKKTAVDAHEAADRAQDTCNELGARGTATEGEMDVADRVADAAIADAQAAQLRVQWAMEEATQDVAHTAA